ncbi:hypothetical protein D9M71_388430 [compost metagenome]
MQRRVQGQVGDLEALSLGVGQAHGVDVTDDHHRRAQQTGRSSRREADRTGTGDVHGAARADASGHGAVIAGRQDVGEAGQVADFFHRPVAIRQFQQVEVGVRHHGVFGLATGPVAHVDVTISTARTRRVDAQADACVHFFAGTAAPASHVERYGHQVADFQVLDVTALLDHFAGDFMAQHKAGLRRGTPAHHVLVGTTDVGGNHFENDPVLDLATARVLHFRIVNLLHFDLASAEIHHTTIARHAFTSLLFLWNRVAQAGSALNARVIAVVICVAYKGLIASKLAPTGFCVVHKSCVRPRSTVGASLLAMAI